MASQEELSDAIRYADKVRNRINLLSVNTIKTVVFTSYKDVEVPEELREEISKLLISYYEKQFESNVKTIVELWNKMQSTKPSTDDGE